MRGCRHCCVIVLGIIKMITLKLHVFVIPVCRYCDLAQIRQDVFYQLATGPRFTVKIPFKIAVGYRYLLVCPGITFFPEKMNGCQVMVILDIGEVLISFYPVHLHKRSGRMNKCYPPARVSFITKNIKPIHKITFYHNPAV